MKRHMMILLAAVFLCGSIWTAAYAGGDRATHRPLAEYGTATWCGFCKYAHGALKQLYAETTHDFFYVSLVTDKCTKASSRASQFNAYGWPTVWFDGGFQVNVGAGSIPSAKTVYNNSLLACESRAVADVDVEVDVRWLGSATMEITATVTNNDAARAYAGTIRVFVTEIVSSLNWIDTAGNPYTFPMLDYAFNQAISVPAGGTWTDTVVWDGKLKNSGYGQTYGTIQMDNIMIIGGVYNNVAHQGYSNPPTGNPFTAYYVDDCAGSMPSTLWSDVDTVPEAGGTVNFTLSADEDNASRNYLLIGGASGADPGFALPGGAVLPVNWDWFSDLAMSLLNTSIFSDFLGTLDANGQASPQLNVPPLPSGSAGLTLYFAACCNNPFDFTSNYATVEIVP